MICHQDIDMIDGKSFLFDSIVNSFEKLSRQLTSQFGENDNVVPDSVAPILPKCINDDRSIDDESSNDSLPRSYQSFAQSATPERVFDTYYDPHHMEDEDDDSLLIRVSKTPLKDLQPTESSNMSLFSYVSSKLCSTPSNLAANETSFNSKNSLLNDLVSTSTWDSNHDIDVEEDWVERYGFHHTQGLSQSDPTRSHSPPLSPLPITDQVDQTSYPEEDLQVGQLFPRTSSSQETNISSDDSSEDSLSRSNLLSTSRVIKSCRSNEFIRPPDTLMGGTLSLNEWQSDLNSSQRLQQDCTESFDHGDNSECASQHSVKSCNDKLENEEKSYCIDVPNSNTEIEPAPECILSYTECPENNTFLAHGDDDSDTTRLSSLEDLESCQSEIEEVSLFKFIDSCLNIYRIV